MLIVRKTRSLFINVSRYVNNTLRYLTIKLLNEHVFIGKLLRVGRHTVISTSDGGKISIGNNVSIGANVHMVAKYGAITIADNVFIGHGVTIVARKSITIGKNSQIAEYVTIRDQNHQVGSQLIRCSDYDTQTISIGEDVWLGAKCTVLKGTIISDKAVIGANSVVTKDIPAATINAGVPSKCLKLREVRL